MLHCFCCVHLGLEIDVYLGGAERSTEELLAIARALSRDSAPRSDVVYGLIPSAELGGEVRVTVIATGFESSPTAPRREIVGLV